MDTTRQLTPLDRFLNDTQRALDTFAVDANADGLVDEVVLDSDEDGIADATLTDTDLEGNVDTVTYGDASVTDPAATATPLVPPAAPAAS